MSTRRSRVGPKGQIVIQKMLREKYRIREGSMVEQIPTEQGVLIRPVKGPLLLKKLDEVAKAIGSVWPKGLSSAEAVREDREKGVGSHT